MATASVRIRVDVHDLDIGALLQSMHAQLRDMTPVNRAIGGVLERNVNLGFDTKTDPGGRAWAAWAQSARAARLREGRGNLLEYTGRMRDSLTHLADARGVEVGFGVNYARYHEQLASGAATLTTLSATVQVVKTS